MDRGARWDTVHAVAKSRTRLSMHTMFSKHCSHIPNFVKRQTPVWLLMCGSFALSLREVPTFSSLCLFTKVTGLTKCTPYLCFPSTLDWKRKDNKEGCLKKLVSVAQHSRQNTISEEQKHHSPHCPSECVQTLKWNQPAGYRPIVRQALGMCFHIWPKSSGRNIQDYDEYRHQADLKITLLQLQGPSRTSEQWLTNFSVLPLWGQLSDILISLPSN